MVSTDKFLYLELHKTGCTHIRKLCSTLLEVELIGKHNSLHEVFGKEASKWNNKHIIGTVRNPWSWYVSLWAYGANSKGGLFNRTTKFSKKKLLQFDLFSEKKWKKVYSDPNDPKLFQEWLKMIMMPSNYKYLGEDYKNTILSRDVGFMTYRFLRIYSTLSMSELQEIESSYKDFDKVVAIDSYILNEQLENDFITALEKAGTSLDEAQKKQILSFKNKKTNTSKRLPISSYFNEESIALIAQREKYIIDKFNYKPPVL